jgi:nucleotide-binding universal stress UspA family protein
MERILVSMDSRHEAWEAWSRALSLAKRIDAKVYALLVLPSTGVDSNSPFHSAASESVGKRLELLIQSAEMDGIHVNYFVTEGCYEEEVIRFIEHNRITLFIVEPADWASRLPERDSTSLQKIRHRIKCRVELVIPRRNHEINH